MARKIAIDSIHLSPSPAFAALNEYRANLAEQLGLELADLLRDNLPTIEDTDEHGQPQTYPGFGYDDEAGALALDQSIAHAIGTVALVTIYDGTIAAPDGGEPYARPVAVYILNLPKLSEIITDSRLANYRETLLGRDLLTKARKLAKADYTGTSPVVADRIAALIAAASRAGSKIGKAYDAIFPVLQGVIIQNVEAKAKSLSAAGQHAQARLIRDTFSKARLNKDTLRECLSSGPAAKMHFPAMPAAQWEQLLKLAISWAPKHKVNKIVRAEDGRTALKTIDPETGKETTVREWIDAPQSPAIFQQWLDTRNETEATAPTVTLDLSDLTVHAA